jgi:hypothetical protein
LLTIGHQYMQQDQSHLGCLESGLAHLEYLLTVPNCFRSIEKSFQFTQRTFAKATVFAMIPVWKSRLTDWGVVIFASVATS